jgi:hypothetical protein
MKRIEQKRERRGVRQRHHRGSHGDDKKKHP